MFEKKELISNIDGSKYTKYFYTFNKSDPIVGILFGHFAPFTGPNGHGRMITTLKNLGAEAFLIATPQNNKPFDDEREMFNSEQRADIINQYLEEQGLEGVAISYKMKRGGAKSQMGPLVSKAAELFGLNIRPVFCFGPDREDLASEVCNKFDEIKDPTHCEYIIDYERGTSGTKVRELIKKGDIEGIMKETGYKKETAEMLIDLRNENLESNKFTESTLNKLSDNKMKSDGNFKGFWYSSKEKTLIDIKPYEEHLEFLLKRPERLGIKENELEEIANKWGTTLKRELHEFYDSGDRESDFLIYALRKGNLRIRFYDTFDNDDNYISIDYYDKRNLKKVSDCIIKYESDIKDSKLPIFLFDYKTDKGEDFKSVKDVLNFTLLNESIEKNKEKLEEGGNLTVNGKSATKLHVANMDNEEFGDFKEDFISFLLSVSDIYMEKTGYPIWNREDLLFEGKVFSGSTRAFFQKDRDIFANKKPKVGDFDVQVPEDIFDTFHDFVLNDLPNMEIGDFVIHGCSQSPGQDHCLVRANKFYPEVGADYIQIDWEYVPFKNNIPTDFATFAHYSSWEDIENDVKGVFMKYLMRALVSTIDERENVTIVSAKTGKPLASANKSTLKHFMGFSVDKGIRTKFIPYLDENGNPLIVDGQEYWVEQPAKESKYTQDVGAMYQLIFNEPATEKDKNDLHSFVRTLNNLMKKFDTERVTKIFFMFSKLLWGPGAQGISAFDPKEDEEVKTSAYNQFLKAFPELKQYSSEIEEMKEKYYNSYKVAQKL